MKEIVNKQDLIDTINQSYENYYQTLIKNKEAINKEELSNNLGWLSQVLQWEKDERMGSILNIHSIDVDKLDKEFNELYINDDIEYIIENYNKVELDLVAYIDKLSDEDLFEPNKRHWTTIRPNSSIYDWIKTYALDNL